MRSNPTQFFAGMALGGALLGGGMLLGGLGQAATRDQRPPNDEILRARQIDIVDELGTVVLSLGVADHGGEINLRDRFGKTLLTAGASKTGGAMMINTADGASVLALSTTSAGGSVWVKGSRSQAATELTAEPTGPRLAMTSADGHPLAEIRSREHAGCVVSAFNMRGDVASRMFTDAAGCGVIETYGPKSVPLVSLGSTVGGHGQITTYLDTDKPLVSITASADQQGQIYTYNAQGIPLIALASRPAPENCASLRIFNRLGQAAITLEPDEQDRGEIGVWRVDGTGRTITP